MPANAGIQRLRCGKYPLLDPCVRRKEAQRVPPGGCRDHRRGAGDWGSSGSGRCTDCERPDGGRRRPSPSPIPTLGYRNVEYPNRLLQERALRANALACHGESGQEHSRAGCSCSKSNGSFIPLSRVPDGRRELGSLHTPQGECLGRPRIRFTPLAGKPGMLNAEAVSRLGRFLRRRFPRQAGVATCRSAKLARSQIISDLAHLSLTQSTDDTCICCPHLDRRCGANTCEFCFADAP